MVYHVEDLDRAVAFYRDVLGMKISDYIRNLVFFHCNPRHHTLAIIEAKGRNTKKLNHFMLQTQGMNDVGQTYDMVLDSEINVTRGLGRHTNDHMTSFYMKTPSGFDVEYGWGARTVERRHLAGGAPRKGQHLGPPPRPAACRGQLGRVVKLPRHSGESRNLGFPTGKTELDGNASGFRLSPE